MEVHSVHRAEEQGLPRYDYILNTLSLRQAAGYAYIELETAQGVKWLAASQAPVQVGDTVTWQGGSVMNNFTSSSLNRTFDQIIFVAAVSPAQ